MMPLPLRKNRHTQEEIETLLDDGIHHLEMAARELKEYADHVRRDREERQRAIQRRADRTGTD